MISGLTWSKHKIRTTFFIDLIATYAHLLCQLGSFSKVTNLYFTCHVVAGGASSNDFVTRTGNYLQYCNISIHLLSGI